MQIGYWGNVLIHHVREWKHWKYSPWACPFSGVEFCGAFHFQKNNISPAVPDLELILFPLWYWPIMHAHTKQQQDKVFETDFIDSQKSDPPFAHLLALSHIYIHTNHVETCVCTHIFFGQLLFFPKFYKHQGLDQFRHCASVDCWSVNQLMNYFSCGTFPHELRWKKVIFLSFFFFFF